MLTVMLLIFVCCEWEGTLWRMKRDTIGDLKGHCWEWEGRDTIGNGMEHYWGSEGTPMAVRMEACGRALKTPRSSYCI